jgi:hypothetical protein
METVVANQAPRLTAGDAVWVATALLHTEHPSQPDFSEDEIVQCTLREGLTGVDRETVYLHVHTHGVAGLRRQPAQLRMLTETAPGRRRLFRRGDYVHPDRTGAETRRGARILPEPKDLPQAYRWLIDWYRTTYSPPPEGDAQDPILALRGLGKEIWADEDPDAYVSRLRSGWP